jgi:TRAP-type uncharacterized transport system substrate-binding protein
MKTSMPSSHRVFGCAAILLCTMSATLAQEPKGDAAVRVASGPNGKVYTLMVQDMQSVCGKSIPISAVTSTGGLKNLTLLSASEAELGIVQVDVLQQMKDGDANIGELQSVMPLHANLLHVLALKAGSRVDIQTVFGTAVPLTGRNAVLRKFSDLKGMDIAVVGSAQLLGQVLNKQLGYAMQLLIADNDDQAVTMLQAGQVQAIFTLGGWPLPSVRSHKASSGLVLLDYDLEPRAPYVVVKRNYNDLGAFNLPFLGVPNLLVTRPFKPGGATGSRVSALQRCLRQHLDELQEGPYQPGWKEIKDVMASYGVPAWRGDTAVAKSK